MTDTTLGQRIAERRKLLGLSQEGFGEKMGVSRQAISKWEADTSVPEVEKLIAMSKLFGVSVGWLLGTEEEEEQPFQIAAAFRMPQPEPTIPAPPSPAPEPPAPEPAQEPPAQEPVEIKPPRNWLNIVCVAVAVVSLVLSILSMNRREAPADTSSASGDAKKIAALEEQLTSMEEQIVAQQKVNDRQSEWLSEISGLVDTGTAGRQPGPGDGQLQRHSLGGAEGNPVRCRSGRKVRECGLCGVR